MVSVPPSAPIAPPLTGASSRWMPRPARRSPRSRTKAAGTVLHRTTVLPGARVSSAPSSAEQHVLDLGVVDHHDKQQPSVLGRCGRACGGLATGRDQSLERRLAAIATGHRKTRLEQVCRHAGAHGAEPDESDLLVSLHGRILYAAAQPCSMNATVALR